MGQEMDGQQELRMVCLHEHAHAAVARYFGVVDGWVSVERIRPGSLSFRGLRYNGRFCHDRIASARVRRLVGLAGILAELLDGQPDIGADAVFQALEQDPDVLSDSDSEMAGNYRIHHVAECLDLVRELWSDIDSRAREQMLMVT